MFQLIDLIFAGLDVKGVSAVVNYDLANNTEDYVHRWELFCIFSSGGLSFVVSGLVEQEEQG